MVGCVNGAGRLGTDPGPEGGARFIAGPEGTSGTEAGGTGGGRSENIWAETDAGMKQASMEASTSARKSRPARPSPPIPSPHEVMGMLFTENAANSSLRGRAPDVVVQEPAQRRDVNPAVAALVTMLLRPL
jgi:hypothetical protein